MTKKKKKREKNFIPLEFKTTHNQIWFKNGINKLNDYLKSRISEGKKEEDINSIKNDLKFTKCPMCDGMTYNPDYLCFTCGFGSTKNFKPLKILEIPKKPDFPEQCPSCKKSIDKETIYCKFCGVKIKGKSRYIPSAVKEQVWERDGAECVICGKKENLEYDHIIPFSKGGSSSEKNIQLLCSECNQRKYNKIE